ncbi:HlyD family secretion protein [Pedobacter psychrophilus]|nr:HlyD family secretion protein [Pedobacter psychrophilus]
MKKLYYILFAASTILVSCGGKETTDNAQIEANISPVIPKINSTVEQVLVSDNQVVKEGDVLIVLDDANYKIAVQQAEVALALAKQNVSLSQSNKNTANSSVNTVQAGTISANASVEAAKVRVEVANKNFERFKNLLAQKSATQQQFDGIKAEKEAAEAQLKMAQAQVEASKSQVVSTKSSVQSSDNGISLAQLSVKQAENNLEAAQLQLTYCTIKAPCNGVVSKKNVQVGQVVVIAQPLMAIADNENAWIVANFKETQIENVKVGQEVEVDVDAYGDKTFTGKVQSFSQATGAKFSLLPADNATGNFVKVTQRIPVKIILDKQTGNEYPLRAGMSVKVAVKTK